MTALVSKQLKGDREDMRRLQEVLASATEYFSRVAAAPPSTAEAQNLFSALPPNKNYHDKVVLGFYIQDKMIGCADIVRGYLKSETAMIGLLLISANHQRKGFGRLAYNEVEKVCLTWPEIKTARIGIVETNLSVLPFWKEMGFCETGERKPFTCGNVKCESIVLEKDLGTSQRLRNASRT